MEAIDSKFSAMMSELGYAGQVHLSDDGDPSDVRGKGINILVKVSQSGSVGRSAA